MLFFSLVKVFASHWSSNCHVSKVTMVVRLNFNEFQLFLKTA